MAKIFTINNLAILFISSLPVDAFLLLNYNLVISPIFLSFLLVSLLIKKGSNLEITKDSKYLAFIILTLLISSLLFSDDLIESLLKIIILIYYFIIYVSIINVHTLDLKKLFFLYSIVLLSVCLYAYQQNIFFKITYRFSFHKEFNPTWLAAYLMGILFLSYPAFIKSNKLEKIFILFFTLLAIYFIIITQARTLIFSFILTLLIYYIYFILTSFTNLKKFKLSLKIQFVVLLIIVLGFSYFDTAYNFLSDKASRIIVPFETQDYSVATAGRTDAWSDYYKAFFNDPTPTGVDRSMLKLNLINHSHNNYLLLLVEGSIFSLIFWLIFQIILLKTSKTNYEKILAIFFLIFSFGNDMFYYKYYWILLYLFIIIRASFNSSFYKIHVNNNIKII